MDINTPRPLSTLEDYPNPDFPLDQAAHPAIAEPTQMWPSDDNRSSDNGPGERVFDAEGDQAGRLSGYEAAISAAQSTGMAAADARHAYYAQDILPRGAAYGYSMTLMQTVTGPSVGKAGLLAVEGEGYS